MRTLNENTLPEQFAERLAELTAEVTELSRRLGIVEGDRYAETPAGQTNLTIHSYDDEEPSIQFLTENGFVIFRPWEATNTIGPAKAAFRFGVQHPEGVEREISIEISNLLMTETALRTQGRIDATSQFWICCAERRLANYLMERDEFPPANEIIIETMDREDVLLALRWDKTT